MTSTSELRANSGPNSMDESPRAEENGTATHVGELGTSSRPENETVRASSLSNSPSSVSDRAPHDGSRPPSKETFTPSSDEKQEWRATKQEYLVMSVLAVVSFMVALDATIVIPALATFAKDLHGSATAAFWTGTSYLLTNAVFQPFIAALSDIFGRQELLMISLIFFTVGSAIACAAHNFTQLLTGRSLQGVGGGGIMTLVLVVLTDIIPLRQRPKWAISIQLAWAVGTIIGPLVGGAIVQRTTWRWIFYINFPFCGIALVMVPLFVRFETRKTLFREKLARVDWLGGFIFIGGTTSFLLAISWGGIQYAWSSFQTLGPLMFGIAGIILALVWERYGAREPFLRRSLFHSWSAIAGYICAIIQGLLLFSEVYYVGFYLEAVKARSPISAGVALLPITASLIPGSVAVNVLVQRLGHVRGFIWLGWIVLTIASGCCIILDVDTNTASWAAIFVFMGLGHGLLISSLNFEIQAMARTEDVSYAVAMFAFMRAVGSCSGVAIGGTAFQNRMRRQLVHDHLPPSISTDAEGYIATLQTLTANSTVPKQAVLNSYAQGFHGVYEAMLGICIVGLLASLIIKSHSMDQLLDSKHKLKNGGVLKNAGAQEHSSSKEGTVAGTELA